MELTELLAKMVDEGASDLFVSVGAPPLMKIEGKLSPIGAEKITPPTAHALAYSVMDDEQQKTFESTLELNMALDLPRVGRFRVNAYRQRGEPALVVRFVKSEIPDIESLGLPPQLKDLIMEERGLILVVGGTGTGKSTTLASMIDYRNRHREGHILTIEDPVEFIHSHRKSLVNQREVGLDTLSYENALKNALREAPDVILIGEIRDAETMKHALAFAETGHLCLSTLHANNANQAIDRILNFFPQSAHHQILMDLSLHLKSIVSQRLAIGVDGNRVPAVEIMINTPYISELIQKGKIDKIKEAMGQTPDKIDQTFDDALFQLYRQGRIDEQEALRLADSRNNLSLKIRLDEANKPEKLEVQTEVNFARGAPFDGYRRFRLMPVKIDKSRRADMQTVLDTAITTALQAKGLRPDDTAPDIEVQYGLGLKAVQGLTLEPIDNLNTTAIERVLPGGAADATLVINMVDTASGRPVWRVKATTHLPERLGSQEESNEIMADILAAFPPTE